MVLLLSDAVIIEIDDQFEERMAAAFVFQGNLNASAPRRSLPNRLVAMLLL